MLATTKYCFEKVVCKSLLKTSFYITNRPDVALVAEKYGVDRIWVDLETRGKEERQHNLNTVKSRHSISDIECNYRVILNQCRDYLADFESPDFIVKASPEDIANEHRSFPEITNHKAYADKPASACLRFR